MSSYYKNDTVLNCAIGGVCDALWDIKGRQAGMPVYQLVGGKCREAADIYLHVDMGGQIRIPASSWSRTAHEGRPRPAAAICSWRCFGRDGAVNTLYGQPKFDDGVHRLRS